MRRQNSLVPNGKDTKLPACLSFPTPSVSKADLRDEASQHEAHGNITAASKLPHLLSLESQHPVHRTTKSQEVKNGNINVTAHKHNPYTQRIPHGSLLVFL